MTHRGICVLSTFFWTLLLATLLFRNKFVLWLLWLNASALCQHFHAYHGGFQVVLVFMGLTTLGLWNLGWWLSHRVMWWFVGK